MTATGTLALSIGMAAIIAANGAARKGQATSPGGQSVSVTVSLTLENEHVQAGEGTVAVFTLKNIGDRSVSFSTASDLYRVHVSGTDHDPAEAEYQRHRHGDYRPGDGPYLVDGPVVATELKPGESVSRKLNLKMFYDLSKPGKYSVYMEIYDPSGPIDQSGLWLRTNTAQFEVESKAR
jgi:hypothetical protein